MSQEDVLSGSFFEHEISCRTKLWGGDDQVQTTDVQAPDAVSLLIT